MNQAEVDKFIADSIAASEARAAREDPVTWGLYWTEATILQAQRVRQYFLWSRSVGRGHNINETTGRLEELNLLTAANKARRWIEYADCPMWDVAAVEPFLTLLKKAKFVRDKREHDEEYGRGGKPHPLTDATSKHGGPTIKVSPGVTELRDGAIILGGIVDVDALVVAAERAAEALRVVQHQQVPADCFKTTPRLKGPNLP